MLKWDVYNKMSLEEKEEYDYKFGTEDNNPPMLIRDSITLYAVGTNLVFLVYIIVTDNKFEAYKGEVVTLFNSINIIVFIFAWTGVIFLLNWIISKVIKERQRHNWLKERNIRNR